MNDLIKSYIKDRLIDFSVTEYGKFIDIILGWPNIFGLFFNNMALVALSCL